VGGSALRWMQKLAKEEGLDDLRLAVGGRSRANYEGFVRRWQERTADPPPAFVVCDHSDAASVCAALAGGWDLVVHTAGPFQGVRSASLLEGAIAAGVPYVDVCDDTDLCRIAKELEPQCQAAGVTALVSTGIWPGVSALMVAEAARRLGQAERVEMSFYTAGTGGAGPTIVSATFLLLAEPPLVYEAGKEVRAEPWGERRLADFGPGVGEQFVHLLDEPECYTCQRALGIPNIRSSFGTAPDIWNWLFAAVKLLPADILRNRGLMQAVANFSMPIIGAVDALVGAKNAMRVDAFDAEGRQVTLRLTHSDLEDCVGLGTAAFAMEALQARVAPGVWFPVELEASRRTAILDRVSREAIFSEL